jgi:UDP-GlcNAc:undecaprenyl-phosphate/decaprenyl-phosphate GlcNAc-1-phosphate transferase
MVSVETWLFCTICGLATTILGIFAPKLCKKMGLIDVPDARKTHQRPTPLLGGLALALIALPTSVIYGIFLSSPELLPSILIFISAAIAMVLMGMEDDRRTLTARNRLILSLIIFASVATFDPLFNIRVLRFGNGAFEIGMGVAAVGIIFTTICCVGLVNAVNMADGKNGLVIGLCLGWLAMLATRAPLGLLPFILILISNLAVLLIFNLRGSVFLGDGGVYGLGCTIGLLAIAIYNSPGPVAGYAMAAEELMLLFGVPVLDSFRLTFTRLRRGQSPMAPDRDHFHHHLQSKFGWPMGLVAYLVIALVPPALGFMDFIRPTICLFFVVLIYFAMILLTRGYVHADDHLDQQR